MQLRGRTATNTASGLALFIQSLANDGRAVVSGRGRDEQETDALPLLEKLDAQLREDLAIALPSFYPEAALWGARLFHQLCRFVVCRDIGEDQIDAACAAPGPAPRCPQTDWSADLTLRHLPKLFRLASHFSNGDPLVGQMKKIAVAWPLSSVGIGGLDNIRIESFSNDSALMRLYADRIIAAGDDSRLGNPAVDNLLRADLGIHHELAPVIAARLFSNKT
jgi:hypothetical protein